MLWIYLVLVNFDEAPRNDDPFPDPALLDTIDNDQSQCIAKAFKAITEQVKNRRLPQEHHPSLESIVHEHMDIFQTQLSASPPADIPPSQIYLHMMRFRHGLNWGTSHNLKKSSSESLCRHYARKEYSTLTPQASLSSTPLLVPKSRGAKWRFTVDLRAVNMFTEPISDGQPLKLVTHSTWLYANFDLSHGYLEPSMATYTQECRFLLLPMASSRPYVCYMAHRM